jgi:hypothetical protein
MHAKIQGRDKEAMSFEQLVEDYILNEFLIIDKEYKRQGRNLEKEGIEETELKERVRQRLLSEHPELQTEIERDF